MAVENLVLCWFVDHAGFVALICRRILTSPGIYAWEHLFPLSDLLTQFSCCTIPPTRRRPFRFCRRACQTALAVAEIRTDQRRNTAKRPVSSHADLSILADANLMR